MTKTSTDAQIVGSVSFINGDAQQFTDAKEYLDCIREELPHEATTGFRFRTITQDPASVSYTHLTLPTSDLV